MDDRYPLRYCVVWDVRLGGRMGGAWGRDRDVQSRWGLAAGLIGTILAGDQDE